MDADSIFADPYGLAGQKKEEFIVSNINQRNKKHFLHCGEFNMSRGVFPEYQFDALQTKEPYLFAPSSISS